MVESERQLWCSVLLQALIDVTGTGAGKEYRPDMDMPRARSWIWSDFDDVGSFVWICDLLGFRPEYVRRKVAGLPTCSKRGWVRPYFKR